MLKLFTSSFSIFIAVILLAFILGISFYFTYSEIERSAQEVALGEIQNVSLTQTHDFGKIIENALMDIVTNLKTIANSPPVQQSQDIKDMIILMNAAQSSTYNITEYYRILDKNGKMTAISNILDKEQYNQSIDLDFSNSSYFIISKEIHKAFVSDLTNPINKTARFSISVPVLIKENSLKEKFVFNYTTNNDFISIHNNNTLQKAIFTGIIEASVSIVKLKNLLEQSMLLSELNEITLLDRNGTIMFSDHEDLLGENFFSEKVQSLLFNHLSIKESDNINILINDALNGNSGIYNLNSTTQTSTFSTKPISLEGDQFMTLLLKKPYKLDTEVIYFLNLQRNFSIIAIFSIVVVSSILGYFLFTLNKRLQTHVSNQTNKLNQNVEQLRKANEKLKKHDKMQKEFINIAAHELRTPTQSIMGYIEMLELNPTNSKKYVSLLKNNSERLYRLIQGILDITKIESGNLAIQKTKFDLKEVIYNVINDTITSKNKNWKRQNVKFIFQPLKEPTVISADRERIYQVTSNLIKNAIKFNTTDEAKIEIKLEKIKDEKKKKELVSIKIRDNGKGIDSEIMTRLFTIFTTESEFGGTGLGLYISKNIVEAHGGAIRGYNNQDGKGATFEFTLPL
jgi:signal transduction histidine kinase